jgi:DNA replication protein DnaC
LLESRAIAADGRVTPHLWTLHINRVMFCTTLLDDWGLEPLGRQARHDLLEILEDRYGRASTIMTGQLPVEAWHGAINQATYADAILDRLIHNAHRLELSGESMRRPPTKKTHPAA